MKLIILFISLICIKPNWVTSKGHPISSGAAPEKITSSELHELPLLPSLFFIPGN